MEFVQQKIAYKAERAGKLFIQVDSKHTSQICPSCGGRKSKPIYQRIHDCPCGYRDGRDHASSLVILERGIEKVRSERPELMFVNSRPLHTPASFVKTDWMKQEASLKDGVVRPD